MAGNAAVARSLPNSIRIGDCAVIPNHVITWKPSSSTLPAQSLFLSNGDLTASLRMLNSIVVAAVRLRSEGPRGHWASIKIRRSEEVIGTLHFLNKWKSERQPQVGFNSIDSRHNGISFHALLGKNALRRFVAFLSTCNVPDPERTLERLLDRRRGDMRWLRSVTRSERSIITTKSKGY